MAEKTRSVGLIILSVLSNYGLVAVIQRRGEFNHEKMAPESYPGGCQITVHGKVEPKETSLMALSREIGEELGQEVKNMIDMKRVKKLGRVTSGRETIEIFVLSLHQDFIAKIRLSPSSGGLRFLPSFHFDKVLGDVEDLNRYSKQFGVIDRHITAMFPDEMEAVRKAFKILKK